MSQQFFDVKEHVFEGQHIREFPRATAHNQEEVLELVAKQYIPKNNPNPQPGDVTILGAHANGFPKELYEPLWDELLALSAAQGFRIRSIWIADVATHGQSARRNEEGARLGNDPSWYDHPRDLLQMVNRFRREMPRPLVGVGHSYGGTMLTQLSLLHPRLLSALVLLDPTMHTREASGFSPLALSAARRERWPSRAAAAASFRRSPFYGAWDPRVLDAWVAHGLRDLPTPLFPDETEGVTLATTKHQEVFMYLRPLAQGVDRATGRRVFRRDRVPDVGDAQLAELRAQGAQLYRPEVPNTAAQLPHVRPGVCYVFGATSEVSTPPLRAEKLAQTGVGVGGSGGVAAGRVRAVVLPKTGHLVAMEQPKACAVAAAEWIGTELARWREEEAELTGWWSRADADKQTVDAEWQSFIGTTGKGAKGTIKGKL